MEDVCVDNSSNTCIYADVCDVYGKIRNKKPAVSCLADTAGFLLNSLIIINEGQNISFDPSYH